MESLASRCRKVGIIDCACECGWDNDGHLIVVDRWAHDWPPIPYIEMIEFYLDSGMDPDDQVSECPNCGEELDTEFCTERR